MSTVRAWLLLFCAVAATAHAKSPRGPANEVPLDRVRYHLANVSENSRNMRFLMGGVFLGVGALFTGAIIANDRLRTGEPRNLALGVLGVSGGIALLGSAIIFLFPTDYELLPANYLRMKDARAEYGESLLRQLAHRAKSTRQLVGGGMVALGAADIVWHLAEGGTSATSFLAYKGTLLGTIGLALVLFKWPAELEYEDYRTGGDAGTSWNLSPTMNGLALVVPFVL